MAAWGRDRGEIPDLEFYRMMLSYTRRKQWESRVLAGEVWALLGAAMDGKGARHQAGESHGYREVGADELLGKIGIDDF